MISEEEEQQAAPSLQCRNEIYFLMPYIYIYEAQFQLCEKASILYCIYNVAIHF